MDDLTKKRNKNIIEAHLKEVDIILDDLIEELRLNYIIDLTPEMLNDMYKLAFDKWQFLYKYGFIKKSPS